MSVAPYPWHRLRRLTRTQAQLESTVAGWIAARSRGDRLGKLVASPVQVDVVEPAAFDPYAAHCQVRVLGAAIDVRGSSIGVRRIAQRILGGPAELMAARPLGVVERSLWTLVVATALEDVGVAGTVWPVLDEEPRIESTPDERRTRAGHASAKQRPVDPAADRARACLESSAVVELAVMLGEIPLAVQLHVLAGLSPAVSSRAPAQVPSLSHEDLARASRPVGTWPAWFDATALPLQVVLGRCALARADVDRLAVRSVVTLERASDELHENLARSRAGSHALVLDVLGGAVGLRATAGGLDAEVVTGYVRRDMSLPDEAHIELTVGLGATRLTLRQIADLAVGQIVQLGRPLAGPFEVRAAGRVVGRGELVEVDGELAVRIVSLGDQEL